MKKLLTFICWLMVFIPWSIVPLRSNPWALASAAAEIIIYSYAAFMIFSAVFTILCYTKGKVKNRIMEIAAVINGIYGVGAVSLIGLGIYTALR